VYNILEVLKTYKQNGNNIPTFLQVSSDETYGDIVNGAHKETDMLNPSNPYSATKAAADQLILAWARTYKLPYVIVRPTNNYGVGQYVEKLIPKTCKFLQLGKKIPLHDNGEPFRNWLHAKDTARGIIKIIENNKQNEIYNIAGGFEQSNIVTVKKIISEYFGGKLPADYEKYLDLSFKRQGQDVRYALNDDKLRALGWSPECNFDHELKDIVLYYKNTFIW
jgi:dTDP-glucose 4,6-dehydratase